MPTDTSQPKELAVPLTKEQATAWKGRITAVEKRRATQLKEWQKSVRAFEGEPFDASPDIDTVNVNKDWPRVKSKLAQLFFRVPEIQLSARQEIAKQIAPVFAAGLNFTLSKRIKAEHMMDEVLTDVLNASGIGISKVGVEVTSVPVEVPKQDVSQVPPEQVPQLIEEGAVEMVTVQQPIHTEYFWKRVSPAKFIWPIEFRGSDWDDAPWLGFEFRENAKLAREKYGLGDEKEVVASKREDTLSDDCKDDSSVDREDEIRGWEIWYWAARYDPKAHPLQIRRIVFIEGKEEPVVHEDSPYQRIVPGPNGKQKFVGVNKLPIRVLTLTYVSDKAIPPSDSKIARPQVLELMRGRSQIIQQRESAIPLRWFDATRVDEEEEEMLRTGRVSGWIPTQGPGDGMFGEVARANYPRENFEFDRVANQDLDESWSMGSNQIGVETSGETTAEEVRTIQANSNTRLDYERAKVLRYFVQGAELVGALMQLFHEDTDWAEVVGDDGVKRLQQWDRQTIQGEFLFEAKPDAALRVDIAQERADARNLYQFLANDPNVDRRKLIEWVLRTHNVDPQSFFAPPPQPQPPQPATSFRFSGEDLINPMALTVLMKTGVQISPQDIQNAVQMIQMATQAVQQPGMPPEATATMLGEPTEPEPQTEHGGAQPLAEPLSKHHADGKHT